MRLRMTLNGTSELMNTGTDATPLGTLFGDVTFAFDPPPT